MLGINGEYLDVIMSPNGRILRQTFKARIDYYIVTVRFDDSCNNGHASFAVTLSSPNMGGCCHEKIVELWPALSPLIKWHGMTTRGPSGYPNNPIYFAGDRDCWGLLEGETRQLRNGKTGVLSWKLAKNPLPTYVNSPEQPQETFTLRYVPWNTIGEGKSRELGLAREAAVWPDATDEDLCQDPEALRKTLHRRLPALIREFKQAILDAGLIWPAER